MATGDRGEELREAATHRGLKLVKSRRRKPGAGDYGLFGLTDADGRKLLGFGDDGLTASADDIAAYLREGTATSTWAESARTTPVRVKAEVKEAPSPPTGREKSAPPKSRSARKTEAGLEVIAPKREPEPEPATLPQLLVRKARAADAAAIATLIDGDPTDIARMISANAPMMVAERGELVGCVLCHRIPTLQRGNIGRITSIFVRRDDRRQGVGTALIEAARAVLAKDCATIEAMSDIDVRNIHGFFRALGFEQSSYRFTIAGAP